MININMKFIRKQDAVAYYNKLKNKSAYNLYQEDINKIGSKCFHVMDNKTLFNNIRTLKEPHYYEFWTEDMKLVFGVDIDFDRKKNKESPDFILRKVIEIVKRGASEYYKYEYETKNIIIIENDNATQKLDNANKYSAHIIFRGLSFQNCLVVKDFYLRLDKDYNISKYFVDKSIYNLTCLRLFLNSKNGKHSILVPKCIQYNKESTYTCNKNIYEYFLKTMITYTNDSPTQITINNIKHKQEKLMPTCLDSGNDYSNVDIESILNNLPKKYYENYDLWIKTGMILHSCDVKLFDIWDKWSAQGSSYKQKEMQSKWKSFENNNNKMTIGTLIKWARDEGIVKIFKNTKPNIKEIVDNYPLKPITININDINKKNITIINKEKLTEDIYIPILHKKFIGIQSEKGTGKTSNVLKVLFNKKVSWVDDNTSILFISSRITFGYKLFGDLKNYGFDLYSQTKGDIFSKRIICQIDSLRRLNFDVKYDLIIVDECESLARYLTSSHFTKNNSSSLTVAYLNQRLFEAKQVIAMDADFSDRCLKYYTTILSSQNDMHIIINEYKAYKEYKLIYCKYESWVRKILYMMDKNKKLVIAMASNSKAKDLDKKLKDTFNDKKILLIHKETTDDDKKNYLLKVNEEWIKYDVVIYTPSVCMGVSFDITGHFDYIFAYGCHESLGAQEWCQMIHRVREPINKDIFISIDNYKSFDRIEDTITYQTVEKMLCSDYYLTNYDLHNNIIPKKVIRADTNNNIDSIGTVNVNDKLIIYPFKEEPIYDMYVRNSLEQIENKLNFPACFFGYVKYKEYQLEYCPPCEEDKLILQDLKNIRLEREDQEFEQKINGILDAPDITSDEYVEKRKYKDEYNTTCDFNAMFRYDLRTCYNIPKINENEEDDNFTKDFISEYCSPIKMKWYKNIALILGTPEQSTENKLQILQENQIYYEKFNGCYGTLTKINKYVYHYYPLEIIKIIGFDINDISKTISYPDLIIKIYDAIGFCDNNKDMILHRYNIKNTSTNLSNLSETEQLKFINKILETVYGLRIKRINNSVYEDNILYRLSDNDVWNNLPNRIIYDKPNLKQKIIPINIYSKQQNDTSFDEMLNSNNPFIDDYNL